MTYHQPYIWWGYAWSDPKNDMADDGAVIPPIQCRS